MNFIDEVKIYVKAGDGGAGSTSFRREKFIEFGGPDGGNGGRGGSVILSTVKNLNTLVDFRYKQHFKAKSGIHGMGRNRTGESGEDMILDIPIGTEVYASDGQTLIADLDKPDQMLTLVKGGRGGAGNHCFKSSVNQAPTKANPGEEGEELWIWLRLKLLSDVGLVGLPNAGKSTFLSMVTAAQPKIADYPFTTLKPQLGVVSIDDNEFVIADIPGLIEGASLGKGLGDKFLRHIERCGAILHLIDISEDVVASYNTIIHELKNYTTDLTDKTEIIVLNKCDLLSVQEAEDKKSQLESLIDKPVMLCSMATKFGLQQVLRVLNALKK